MFRRLLKLPEKPTTSFFLWGPRQTGKTSLLKSLYPEATYIDLLLSEDRLRYLEDPSSFRKEMLAAQPKCDFVIIDEVQKVPAILDEVHWLIENTNLKFCLCGSSARKLKREGANLLGGRALRYELFGLTSAELEDSFCLERILNHGYLPLIYQSDIPQQLHRAYVANYLTEEVAAEGLVRNLPRFSDFLRVAALSDTDIVNFSKIAEDCHVSAPTAKEHFQILIDTLLGRYLPGYSHRQKRKIVQAPKFYLTDVGIVNFLCKRGTILLGSEIAGRAFENFMFHELSAYSLYNEKYIDLSYWKLAGTKHEVDFVLNEMEVAIEVKTAHRIAGHHLRSLHELKRENPKVKRRLLVCRAPRKMIESDGIEIWPYAEFLTALWGGDII